LWTLILLATYDSKFQPCIVIINSTGLGAARMYHSGINTDHKG